MAGLYRNHCWAAFPMNPRPTAAKDENSAAPTVNISQDDDSSLPLLAGSLLEKLPGELGLSETIWKVLAQTYLAQLPHRIERLRQTLTSGDIEGAMNVAHDLGTASHTIGADRLAACALHLERQFRDQTREPALTPAVPQLDAFGKIQLCAQRTGALLQSRLQN